MQVYEMKRRLRQERTPTSQKSYAFHIPKIFPKFQGLKVIKNSNAFAEKDSEI